MSGPQDPAAAGNDRMRAGHADREQVIEALKGAFVHGRLTRDELGTRVGRALAARTYADLAALTADIPAEPVARSAGPPARAHRRPLARAAAGSGGCLVIAFGVVQLIHLADPGATPGPLPIALAGPLFVLLFSAVSAALVILCRGVAAEVDQRCSRRQLPPRHGPGGHAWPAGQRGGTGHDLGPPGPRTGQARAVLRPHQPRRHRPCSPARAGRAPGGARPAPGPV